MEFLRSLGGSPFLTLLILIGLWSDGRLQSPTEKTQLIAPLELEVKYLRERLTKAETLLETHQRSGGHMEMDFRMDDVEEWIENHSHSNE